MEKYVQPKCGLKDAPIDSFLSLLHHIFPTGKLPKNMKTIREWLKRPFGNDGYIDIVYYATCCQTVDTNTNTHCEICRQNEKKHMSVGYREASNHQHLIIAQHHIIVACRNNIVCGQWIEGKESILVSRFSYKHC